MAKTPTIEISIKGINEFWKRTTKLLVGDPRSTTDDSGRPVETTAVPQGLPEYVKETPGGLIYTPEWYEKEYRGEFPAKEGFDISRWGGSIDVGDPLPSGVSITGDFWVATYIDPLNQHFPLAVGDELDLDPRDFDLQKEEFWQHLQAFNDGDRMVINPRNWSVQCPLTKKKITVLQLMDLGKTPPSSLALLDKMARILPSSSSPKGTPSMVSLGLSEAEKKEFMEKYLGSLTSSKARSSMGSEKNSMRFSRLKSTT